MPKKALGTITEADRKALIVFKRLRFLTTEQLAYWLAVSPNAAYQRLKSLIGKGFVLESKEQQPFVYCLSKAGTNVMSVEYQSRWYSAPSMHQYLMRNEFEIYYQKEVDESFAMLDRRAWRRFGLACQVGEHIARVGAERVLVVIDDYLMNPARVGHLLYRLHETKNNLDYLEHVRTTGKSYIPRWCNAVKRVFFVSTHESQIDEFTQLYSSSVIEVTEPLTRSARSSGAKPKVVAQLPYEVHCIKPIWSVA